MDVVVLVQVWANCGHARQALGRYSVIVKRPRLVLEANEAVGATYEDDPVWLVVVANRGEAPAYDVSFGDQVMTLAPDETLRSEWHFRGMMSDIDENGNQVMATGPVPSAAELQMWTGLTWRDRPDGRVRERTVSIAEGRDLDRRTGASVREARLRFIVRMIRFRNRPSKLRKRLGSASKAG